MLTKNLISAGYCSVQLRDRGSHGHGGELERLQFLLIEQRHQHSDHRASNRQTQHGDHALLHLHHRQSLQPRNEAGSHRPIIVLRLAFPTPTSVHHTQCTLPHPNQQQLRSRPSAGLGDGVAHWIGGASLLGLARVETVLAPVLY